MKNLINYVFILSFCVAFSQKKVTLSQALNIASKQSMLSVRLAKAKVFKVTHPDNTATKQKLGVSLIQFEQNLSVLADIELPKDIHLKVSTLEMLWSSYKSVILDNDLKSVKKTVDFNKVITTHTKDIFKSILKVSKEATEYPYNSKLPGFSSAYIASNDLKYLSQELSLYYNVFYSKVLDYDLELFNTLVSDIDSRVNDILKLKDTSDTEIQNKTTDVQNKWILLKSKILSTKDAYFVITKQSPKPEYIFNQSDFLLKEADLLTRLYKANNTIN